jgi:alpha-L-fucosidase
MQSGLCVSGDEALQKKIENRINFSRMGFGLFTHYGLYSLLERGEWVMDHEHIPADEYESLAKQFTCERFDADTIIRTAADAGARYFILTTRHHDGFSLFDTKGLSEFDAPHSACGRDLVEEFCEACARYSVVPFFYHTIIDWHSELYKRDMNGYLQYLRESIKILCTQYGQAGGFWFDGTWSNPDFDWELARLYAIIRKYQPGAIITNNTGLDARGSLGVNDVDCVTFERGRPEKRLVSSDGSFLAGEMCETVREHWGYAHNDIAFKDMGNLLESLLVCRSYGVNLALNIALDSQGGMDTIDCGILQSFQKWFALYGEAFRDVTPMGYSENGKDFCVRGQDGKIYLFVFSLGMEGSTDVVLHGGSVKIVLFSDFPQIVQSVVWMDNGEELEFEQKETALKIRATFFSYGKNMIVRAARIDGLEAEAYQNQKVRETA